MNHLYYGDNLRVLRGSIKDDSVDLIYLDLPFNSNASYNVLFKGPAGADSGADIGVFLTLTEPSLPMITEAAGAGQYDMDGFSPAPRIQIVTIEDAMALRDPAVKLPARRGEAFKRAAKEEDQTRQKALDL
jgi:hypothetical protein